jgi:hypothetical protein
VRHELLQQHPVLYEKESEIVAQVQRVKERKRESEGLLDGGFGQSLFSFLLRGRAWSV